MGIFDTILLIIIAGFVFYGLFFGLIKTVGSLVGVVLGIFIANMFYLQFFDLAKGMMFGFDRTGKFVCFFIIFTIANRLICFLFSLLDKALTVISLIPFVKLINRLGGAILGFVEGSVILGLIFFYINHFNILKSLSKTIDSSKIVPVTVKFAQNFLHFLPAIIDKVKNWV